MATDPNDIPPELLEAIETALTLRGTGPNGAYEIISGEVHLDDSLAEILPDVGTED